MPSLLTRECGIGLVREQHVLHERRIHIAKRAAVEEQHIGVAGGPAIGAEVADVEEVARADGADRVAHDCRAARWRGVRVR